MRTLAIGQNIVKFNNFKSNENQPKVTEVPINKGPKKPMKTKNEILPIVTAAVAVTSLGVSAAAIVRGRKANKGVGEAFESKLEGINRNFETLTAKISELKTEIAKKPDSVGEEVTTKLKNLTDEINVLKEAGAVDKLNNKVEKALLGFASGVMIAASIWSLIMPSIDMSSHMKMPWIPATIGFLLGIGFLLLLDTIIPHMHLNNDEPEGIKTKMKKQNLLMFAVTLHNIPEGMAVGVVLAGAYYGNELLTISGALTLAIGIAMQNLPEGAILSMPLKSEGMSKPKAFLMGTLSGVVEPIASIINRRI